MNDESLTTPSVDKKQEFISRVNQIKFGCIAYKLMFPDEGTAWSWEQANQAIERYQKYLILVYFYPDKIIVPSRTIDKVWHNHILDTHKYYKDCNTLFGKYVHHFPYYGVRDENDRQALEESFSETQNLWAKHFGGKM